MKKFLALILALVMALSLVACGQKEDAPVDTDEGEEATEAAYAVAMVTDYGDITDQSFNQTTYEACKAFCEANGMDFQYYKPASDSDEDRTTSIETAIDEGYNVIVTPGYAFAGALKATVETYPDVTFIALDVSAGDFGDDYTIPANLYSAVYQEELCGYMAGYAAVKMGYKNLGYCGGMAVPAVVRYGYGFVQGVDAAAAELELTDVSVKYVYGNQFFGDADITAYMDTWFSADTEVVFACGGGIFTSVAESAAKYDKKVIGVDVDQAAIIDGMSAEGTTITSAMKGLAATVDTMLAKVVAGEFEGGKIENLGLVSAVPAENFVQIAPSTQFNDTFTQADYEALVAAMFAGEVEVVSDYTVVAEDGTESMMAAADFATVISVEEFGNIK